MSGHVATARDVARAVVATHLPAPLATTLALGERPLPDEVWRPFAALTERNRLTALVASIAANGQFPLTAVQHEELAGLARREAVRVLQLEQLLADVVGELEAARIEVVVLKGAALAHAVYPDPSLRQYVDVDLLVRRSDFDRAIGLLLRRAGWRRVHEEPRPGFVARFGKSAEVRSPDRSIDLHVSLASGEHALLIGTADLFQGTTSFEMSGRRFLALRPEAQLIHACFHATLGNPNNKLLPMLDVAHTVVADFDPEIVQDLASRWRAGVVVREAVARAWEVLAVSTPPPAIVDAGGAGEVLPIATDEGDEGIRAALTTVRQLPTARDRASYVAALLFPTRSYLAERDQSRWTRVLAGVAPRRNDRRTTGR